MLACRHFMRFNRPTYISPAEHLWNGWVEVFEKGRPYWSSFETGLFDAYITHLLSSPSCRREVGADEEWLKEIRGKIKKEWEEVTKDC